MQTPSVHDVVEATEKTTQEVVTTENSNTHEDAKGVHLSDKTPRKQDDQPCTPVKLRRWKSERRWWFAEEGRPEEASDEGEDPEAEVRAPEECTHRREQGENDEYYEYSNCNCRLYDSLVLFQFDEDEEKTAIEPSHVSVDDDWEKVSTLISCKVNVGVCRYCRQWRKMYPRRRTRSSRIW